MIRRKDRSSILAATVADAHDSTEKPIATVQAADADNVDDAVNAARAALKHESWKGISASERGLLMFRLADLIEEKKELLATIDAWDNGLLPPHR